MMQMPRYITEGDEKVDFFDVLKEAYNEYTDRHELFDYLQSQFPNLKRECIRSRVRRYDPEKDYTDYNYVSTDCQNTLSNENIAESVDVNKPITRSVEYKADGSTMFERIIALTESENLTPEKILEAHGMDKDLWEVISCKSNFYQQQKKGGTVLNLYQSKICVKPRTNSVSLEKIKKNFDEWQSNFKPLEVGVPSKDAKYLYEINIADLHLGKFCTEQETGEYLDSKLAEKRFFEVIRKECANIVKYGNQIEKILFVWTNDFFNSDGMSNATTGGTPQDTDMKWQKLYVTGVNMLIKAIDLLSRYAPVKTFYIASNHSRQVDYYALCTLYAWFRNYENVEIDTDPSPRYYERYGVNLIGFAHSYYEKKQNLPHLMQIERAKDWGETKYREYHLAHYHSEKVEEKGGIIFRWLPSITGADTWSNDCGYIGAVKRSYSFVYDKTKGLIQINSTIVE